MADNPLPAKRYLPAPGLRQFAASQKSKRLAPRIQNGWKKSKRLSGDHSGFFNRSLLLFSLLLS
ncbi:hypothetical protein D9F29_16660 [Escherichia coli]|nr:hypothetical protein [Escherichia coli]HAH9824895.1 hypothetical protein [Escherichia coli]